MKNGNRDKVVETRFEPDAGFEMGLPAPVPVRGTAENELEQLKGRLLRQLLAPVVDPGMDVALRRAANEAASVAWFTPFPLLFFPTLLEEKAARARRQRDRQREIRRRSQGLLGEAVF